MGRLSTSEVGLDGQPRRPRQRLDRTTILDAAVRLAETSDAHAVTFRRLGSALGTDPTAVYRHFRDKEELLRAVADRLIGQALADIADIPSDADWRQQLMALGRTTLEVFAAHPAIGVHAAVLTTGGPAELNAIDLILRLFRQAGLGPEEAVRFYGVFSSYLLSVAGASAANRLHQGPDEDGHETVWVGDVGAVDARRHPDVAAVAPYLAALRDQDIFIAGMEVILDAATDAVRRRARLPVSAESAAE